MHSFILSPFLGLPELKAAIDQNRPREELIEQLQRVERALPICHICPDVPYYVITPPTFEVPARWAEMLSSFSLQSITLDRLFHKSFMPFDISLFQKRVHDDNSFFSLLTESKAVLIDLDYGISPYASASPQWGNVAFTRQILNRYSRLYPEINKDPDLFLSLGAVRNQRLAVRKFPGLPYSPIVLSVNTRAELDLFLAAMQNRCDLGSGYEIWFRGQTDDYLLDDLREEASRGICPWRTRLDSSLVPSLYRQLPEHLNDLQSYASFCFEYGSYSRFLKHDLDLPDFTSRKPTDPLTELVNEEWHKRYPEPTFIRTTDGKIQTSTMFVRRHGEDLVDMAADGDEIRDYHVIYRSLQQVFFMQHYGLPSNVLDITRDIDIALFFAQNRVVEQTVVPVDFGKSKPTIYAFLLKPGLDLYLDSHKLSEHHGLLRPVRQKCGLMFGASFINRNDYARFIAVKLQLNRPIQYEADPAYLFPGPSEDGFLGRLLEFQQRREFRFLRPWVYKRTGGLP